MQKYTVNYTTKEAVRDISIKHENVLYFLFDEIEKILLTSEKYGETNVDADGKFIAANPGAILIPLVDKNRNPNLKKLNMSLLMSYKFLLQKTLDEVSIIDEYEFHPSIIIKKVVHHRTDDVIYIMKVIHEALVLPPEDMIEYVDEETATNLVKLDPEWNKSVNGLTISEDGDLELDIEIKEE